MASDNAKTALLCAYTLACAKQYAKAEGLILSDTELAKTPEAMDLLARIRVEQGDPAEARRLWQEIQALHPEHKPSRVALRNLGKPSRGGLWKAFAEAGKWGVLAAFALASLLWVGLFLLFGLTRDPAEAEPDVRRVTDVTWAGIPTGRDLAALGHWKGQAGWAQLSSDFFADPARSAHRAVLTAMVAETLAIPESRIFLGTAPDDAPEGQIRVELYR